MTRSIISSPDAPAAIGPYSQAVKVGNQVFLSGQIGLDPVSMQMVEGVEAQAVRVFDNLKAVAEAAGASFADVQWECGILLFSTLIFLSVAALLFSWNE